MYLCNPNSQMISFILIWVDELLIIIMLIYHQVRGVWCYFEEQGQRYLASERSLIITITIIIRLLHHLTYSSSSAATFPQVPFRCKLSKNLIGSRIKRSGGLGRGLLRLAVRRKQGRDLDVGLVL